MSSPAPWTTLVSPADLATRLAADPAALLVLDVRFDLRDPAAGRQAYDAGHLPQAHHLDLETDLSGPRDGRNGRHPLPTRGAFAARLSRLGLRTGQQVVAYDASGGMFAARAWWMLQWVGHGAVAVLDGGWPAWCEAGLPVAREAPPLPSPSGFEAAAPTVGSVDHATLRGLLETADPVIVDARAADRFRGENETLDPVGGHIPGARNRCFQDNLRDGRFKPAEMLRAEWQALLAGTPAGAAIHQCGSGVTACHNLLALAHAGLSGGRLYPGSWSEWCAQPGAPVARG